MSATKHAHDLFEKWPQLRDLSLNAVVAELAAAEERGRRRGVEEAHDEAGKLRVILLHVRRWMRADSPSWVKAEADAVLPRNLTDLAPRDSGKDGT